MLALGKAPHNEFILDHCKEYDVETLRQMVYRTFKRDLSPNAINSVIHRAKQVNDARAVGRRFPRGARGSSPFNKQPVYAKKRSTVSKLPAQPPEETAVTTLPPTARLLLDSSLGRSHCRFPLHGIGVSLTVCGAAVDGASSYCADCKQRAFLAKKQKQDCFSGRRKK
jgi:hypothetical protein